MHTSHRLTGVLKSAFELQFDDFSKYILLSDVHRGDNSWADDFARNRNIYNHALLHYYENGFTYIEAGDGDELWKNRSFPEIRHAHADTFRLLQKFHEEGRLYMIWGNHDIVKKSSRFISRNMHRCYNCRLRSRQPLFEGMTAHEGILLKHRRSGKSILVVHGHQGDLINDRLWPLGRFLVRYIMRNLELFGFRNPTSPAKNYTRKGIVEERITRWVSANRQMVICGHTHRPMFPSPGQTPYFNTGSCVHPRCITGIEIQEGRIALIKWSIKTKKDGTLYVARDVLAGPTGLEGY